MKLYLASSWRNAEAVLELEHFLKILGFEVYCFANPNAGHFSFNIAETLTNKGYSLIDVDAISALSHPAIAEEFKAAFKCDKEGIDWCDTLILCMPAGKSSHLEAGYAKDTGKLLFIYWMSDPIKGEFDNMYQFADGMYRMEELTDLVDNLRRRG